MTAPETPPALDARGLGRLRRVAQPREVWLTEALDFTPWLAENLDVLADELGVALTLVATEVPVGEFRLDIKAETADGKTVIIENQLERTDHGHLGQLLVYASGLEAALVVWVAPSFRDDHRRTLDWLNERTDEGVSFFGAELGIVQIGDGPKAPVFEVVARPNGWQKQVKAAAGGGGVAPTITPLNAQRQDFFQTVLQRINTTHPAIRVPSRSNGNWSSFAAGPFGYWCISVTNTAQVRLEAYLDTGEQGRNKELFDQVATQVVAPAGLTISWERLPDRRASRVAVYYDTVPPFDVAGEITAVDWLVGAFAQLYAAYDAPLRAEAARLRNQPAADVPAAPPIGE